MRRICVIPYTSKKAQLVDISKLGLNSEKKMSKSEIFYKFV